MKKYFTDYLALSTTNIISLKMIGLVSVVYTVLFSLSISTVVAQPTIEWDKTIGGNSNDELSAIQQTSDGGYILGGYSYSSASGDKSEDSKGKFDYWIVKLNAAGTKEWDKTFGGSNQDLLTSIQQTADGGYILGGWSDSDASGDKSENYKGGFQDYWVVKLNAAGTKEWDKTLGGNGGDNLTSIQQTNDGGYILGGWSDSNANGDKSENSKGGSDYWVVKLNAAGQKEWDKTIGGNGNDYLHSLQQTTDAGYILGGYTFSGASGDKSENSKANPDYWVVKLNAAGTKEWDKTIGGLFGDILLAIQQTTDGGYILGGFSDSNASGDKSENSKGGSDYWVVKLNAAGQKEWDKTIGGNDNDYLTSIQQTTDDGYILGGYSDSNASGDKRENSKGGEDYWVVKLNAAGSKEWDKTLGGNFYDNLYSIKQTADGSFIAGGWSASDASDDKSENTKGGSDYWVVKLSGDTPNNCTLALTTKVTQAEPWYGMWGPLNGAGAIDLTVTGGTAPYTYQWNADVTTQDIPVAVPGQYSVTVTDANGCTGRTTVYVGQNDDSLSLSIAQQHVSAPGQQDGAVDLTVVGGVGPYTYQWNTGATTEDLHYALPGDYRVTVTDARGATATASVRVEVGRTPMMLAKKPAGGEDLFSSATGVKVYPNPATDQTQIIISLAEAGNYTLDLFDIRGAKVKTIAAGKVKDKKALEVKLPVANYSTGVYFLKLVTAKGVYSKRLMVDR